MVLHRSKGALAGALAWVVVGCAAEEADEPMHDAAPVQALVAMQTDLSSADEGTNVARPDAPTTAPSGLGDEAGTDTGAWGSDEDGDEGEKEARPARPDPSRSGAWDAASVSRFCFLLDERMQFLCRVTLTDCTKPARPLDVFTQVLCQVRGFLPGAPRSSSASERSSSGSDVASGI